MGEAGDLLLIFADALARSWKQITKFKASGAAPPAPSPPAPTQSRSNGAGAVTQHDLGEPILKTMPDFSLEGLIRDERGIRMAPESDD